MSRSASGPSILFAFVALSMVACESETAPREPVGAQLLVFGIFDPDFTDRFNPAPARIVWMSTRSGTGRFLSNGRELTDDRVPVSGGELVTTDILPNRLEPEYNDVEIYFVLAQQGATVLTEAVLINVSAECTRHSHCEASCTDFACQ